MVLGVKWPLNADALSDVGLLHGQHGGQHDVESHLFHCRYRDLNVVRGAE